MFTQTLLPALAVFGVVAAQTSTLCSSDALINSQADAERYASCTRIDGDVNIGSTATGIININGPREITGNLIASNASTLNTLGSNSIQSIGGSFTLDRLELLSTLSFTELESVKEISWTALQTLGALTFPAIISKAEKVLITNTFLSTLDGINLATVKVLDISNNRRLRTFSTQVSQVSDTLNIANNGRDLEVSLPNLIWANNAIFRNISSVTVPSLAKVNDTLGLYGTFIEGFAAPNLTEVGNFATGKGGLAFVGNEALTNITLPQLKSVGGAFQIANNTELDSVSFANVATVAGAIDFSGVFTEALLPKLSDVRGGFNMQSKSKLDCSAFDKLRGNVIQGVYTCKGSAADAKSKDGTLSGGTATTDGTPASSSSTNAAVAFGAGEAVVGMSALGALFSFLL